MKKILKVILIIIGLILSVVIIDTLQAIILKNSTIIKWKENLADNDSWVDRGIIVDTYYCTKEKDIVTVSWKLKGFKYTCPIDNVNELDEVKNVSMVIKDGTLTRKSGTIIITDLGGKDYVYGQEYRIDKKEYGYWNALEPITENYAWDLIGYKVDKNNILELNQNWEWLYGELEDGEYRIVKSVTIPGMNENYDFSVEFVID